jgi:hypothetical protein
VVCIIDDMNDFKPRKTFQLPIPGLLKAPDIDFLPLIQRSDQESCENRWLFDVPDLEGLLVTRTNVKDNKYRRVEYFKSLSHGEDYIAHHTLAPSSPPHVHSFSEASIRTL